MAVNCHRIDSEKNDKYVLLVIEFLLLTVIYLVLGLTQVTYAIFAANVAFLIALVVFARETKK